MATLLIDNEACSVIVRANARARRIVMHVDAARREVRVSAPSRSAMRDGLAFARARTAWISEQLRAAPPARAFAPTQSLPLLDGSVRLEAAPHARQAPRLRVNDAGDQALLVGGAPEFFDRRVRDWLKDEARSVLSNAVDRYAMAVGRRAGRVSVREMSSRWGSCGPEGDMRFNWRLIFAPMSIVEYVAAHECAHLVHRNHSRAFWRLVGELGVDADAARDWFEANGPRLFSYGAPPARG